jgi:hypothetical protein
MNGKMLKYELSGEQVNYLLQALNRVQIAGVQSAESLVLMVKTLQNPINATELEKAQLEELKKKYEVKPDKKAN